MVEVLVAPVGRCSLPVIDLTPPHCDLRSANVVASCRMDFVSNQVVSRRFFTALASSVTILVTACGDSMSASSPDAGGARPEDGASTDGEGDGGHSVPCNGGPVMFHMSATEETRAIASVAAVGGTGST